MKNLIDLEKKINSELTTKINKTEIKYNQIYIETDKDDLIDVILFLKTNSDTKFRQLIDITVIDYPENNQRFQIVYLFYKNNLYNISRQENMYNKLYAFSFLLPLILFMCAFTVEYAYKV